MLNNGIWVFPVSVRFILPTADLIYLSVNMVNKLLVFCILASRNDTSPEVPYEKQLSELEEGLVQSIGDPTRRRTNFHMRELSPPAKRVQTGGEEGTGDNEDHIDDPQIKKSDTDAK